MKKRALTKTFQVCLLFAGITAGIQSASAVNTLSHAQTLTSNGAIVLSSSTVPSAGGVTIGYFTGAAPLDSVIKTWTAADAVANLISNNWRDVRTVIDAAAGMQANGDWDWPGGGSPGTVGNRIGGTYNWAFNAGLSSTQLYVFAFNGGSSGFGFNASSVVSPSSSAFTSSSFSGSSEWAALKASNWLFPSTDGTALNLRVVDVDIASELLVGTDLGNNVAMIPEPSSASLIALGIFSFLVHRRKKTTQVEVA